MMQPRFSSQISMGNILQIGVLIVGLSGAWFSLTNRSEQHSMQIESVEQEVIDVRLRVRMIETEQARTEERYLSLFSLLGRIDSRLERIEAAQ